MTPSPRVWIATFAALVFVIGAMAGVVVDRAWLLPPAGTARGVNPPGFGRGMGPGGGSGMGLGRGGGTLVQTPDQVIADLDSELKLSPDQKAAILKILDAWRPRVQELQNTARGQFVSAQEQLHAEIEKTLTAEQAKRFQELSARLLDGGRGPRGGGMGPGRGRGRE
jgi:hypothetical protein